MKIPTCIIFTFLSLIITAQVFGQSYEAMNFNLQKLQTERRVVDSIQSNRAKEYSLQFDIPLLTRTDHYTKQLVGIDDAGIPLFISTDNAKAAITTGVTGVRIGGSLGLNLEGKGMTIGIWDGGKVGHLEYNERIISTEGSNSDAHATHVSGTMVATGINSAAKGMAPKAQLISYDFNNDLSEMAALAKPDQTSLIISNHSYGFVTGWDCTVTPCQWRGNATISNKEDYRFGFYSSNTRNWDVLANNAPYYSIIKSAGNDRSNGSGAIYPPDCNGGSGYDCIEEQATAKNIMTIGAVNAVLNYTDPSSVVMSSFSGWGPTDDGRIKPDLVADGVNVFSTVLNNSYGNLSGTSMSTPNVTGSLALVQELYKKLNGGNYMLASTLKAVAIHTAKEAGTNPGPDFSFGWGLLDVEAASRMLLSKFNKGVIIKEIVLKNGDTYELPIQPKENFKVTATIVWNDPASTATPASLDPTAIKLVNDLDLRITDELGNKEYPWILSTELENLSLPASKGDNIRDNVEKIELLEPTKQVYTLSIKHKGSLTGGSQVVSLVVTYTPVESLPSSLYWVGGSGDWSDPSHWSMSSGGSPGNTIPSSADQVIFDENSFSANGTVNVTENVNCNSLLLLASTEKIEFSLNNKQIGLAGDLVAADTTFRIVDNGTLKFQSATAESKTITLNNCDFTSVNLDFFAGSYVLRGKAKINAINLNSGSLDMANSVLSVQTLSSFGSQSKTLNINNAILSDVVMSSLDTKSNLSLLSDSVVFNINTNTSAQFLWNSVDLKGKVIVNHGTLKVSGDNSIYNLVVKGTLELNGNQMFNKFTIEPGANLILANSTNQIFSRSTLFRANSTNKVTINSPGSATATFNGNYKLCFDYLIIQNITFSGTASINSGLNSVLTNSPNWLSEDCDNVLLPDFEYSFTCANGLTNLSDKSQGQVLTYKWQSDDPTVVFSSTTNSKITATFKSAGSYPVKLTISNSKYSKFIQKTVVIKENDLVSNSIILNNLNLFSKEFASAYQWLKNGVPISGATARSYAFNGAAGEYAVITYSSTCNMISPPLVITGIEQLPGENFVVFPNPAKSQINVSSTIEAPSSIRVFDIIGNLKIETQILGNEPIDISCLSSGLYILEIDKNNVKLRTKFIVAK